jgi:benzoyl-CoA reductase/2-hydroxyglutaryl-CoA dehydratase subunit BcrC/BadD/HgdB
MHVPAAWQSAAARQYYVAELKRLGRFLERLGGVAPDSRRLAREMRRSDSRRAECCEVGDAHAVPVALIGGPLRRCDIAVIELVQRFGGRVALDGSGTGERVLPARFDQSRLEQEPLLELAAAYYGGIPDIGRRPNSEIYVWLRDRLRKRGCRGVILVRHLWCDLWHAEAARLRDWLDVPMLDLELGVVWAEAAMENRIQAFMEMLR